MFYMTCDALLWIAEPMVYHSSGVDDIMALITQKLSSIYQKRQIDEMNETRICCRAHVWTKWINNQIVGVEILHAEIDLNYYFVAFYISMILFLALRSGFKKNSLMESGKCDLSSWNKKK